MNREMVTVPMPKGVYPVESIEPEPEPIEIIPPREVPETSLTIPSKSQYLVSNQTKELLSVVDKMSEGGDNPNVLISGPQGTGKSELATQYAATRDRPLAILEVGRLSDPTMIFGHVDLRDGNTEYIKGLFTEAITTPNCVVHLQEINRPENDKSLNALFSVLDDNQRSIWIDELRDYIRVAPGVVFFASLNEGFEFIGTLPLDEALKSRFHFKIDLVPLPEAAEVRILTTKCGMTNTDVTGLLASLNKLRNNTQTPIYISTRDLVYIAKLIKLGLKQELAIKSVLGNSEDTMESIRLSAHALGQQTAREVLTYEYI
jgi:nitric oxide reductase NorQ protein